MYDPDLTRHPNLAFLWPAFAYASVSEFAANAAKQFAGLAVGPDELLGREPQWATKNTVALELKTARLRNFSVLFLIHHPVSCKTRAPKNDDSPHHWIPTVKYCPLQGWDWPGFQSGKDLQKRLISHNSGRIIRFIQVSQLRVHNQEDLCASTLF